MPRRYSLLLLGLLLQLVLFAARPALAAPTALSSEPERVLCDASSTIVELTSCADLADIPLDPAADAAARADAAAEPDAIDTHAGAPLCDLSAASIAAAVEVPEVDRGRFEQLPCDAELWTALARTDVRECGAFVHPGEQLPPPAAPPTLAPFERYEGAWASTAPLPPGPQPAELAPDRRCGLGASPGHVRKLERPPAARG